MCTSTGKIGLIMHWLSVVGSVVVGRWSLVVGRSSLNVVESKGRLCSFEQSNATWCHTYVHDPWLGRMLNTNEQTNERTKILLNELECQLEWSWNVSWSSWSGAGMSVGVGMSWLENWSWNELAWKLGLEGQVSWSWHGVLWGWHESWSWNLRCS